MFGKKESLEEQAKRWTRDLKKEMRALDRDITKIQREEAKVKAEIRTYAKKGQMNAAKTLAKGVVRTRNQINRMTAAKAQVNSVCMQVKEQIAMQKVAGAMQKSSQLMKGLNRLINVPALAKTAQEMQREMMKAGVVQDVIDDTMAVLDADDLEEEADAQVDKVLQEILSGQMSEVGEIQRKQPAQAEAVDEDDEKELADMKARLARLNA